MAEKQVESQSEEVSFEAPPQEIEEQSPEEKVSKELEGRVSRAEQEIQENRILAQLAADPDFRAVWEAKQKGQKIKVVPEEQKASTPSVPPVEEPEDWSDLPPQKLADYIIKKVGAQVDALVEQKLQPLQDGLSQVHDFAKTQTEREVASQITAAREAHEDFSLYARDMQDISRQNPGLNAEELYQIAKIRKSGGKIPGPQVASERPSTSSARAPERASRKTPLPSGPRGFSELLQGALGRLQFPQNFEDRLE